jgi:threonine/homoserine/homoserine lactone efflux protein
MPVQSSLTLGSMAALAATMLVGASIPSVSVLTVAARSAAFGFSHGLFTSLGIVAGDVVFIVLAIYGLSALSGWMGEHFYLVKYLGGAYLIWLGVVLWRSGSRVDAVGEGARPPSSASSFLAGLLITVGDQKAILFYLGILPAFVDLSGMNLVDTGLIVALAVVAVGGPKLVYAVLADRVGARLKDGRVARAMNAVAGAVMVGVGVLLIAKAQ